MQATSFYTPSNSYTTPSQTVRQQSTTKFTMKIAIGIIVCLGLLFLPQELIAMCAMTACATIALARVITIIMRPNGSPSNKTGSGGPGSDTGEPAYPAPLFGRSSDYDVTDGCNDCCNCCDESAGCLNDCNNDCCTAPTNVSNDKPDIDCCKPCTDACTDCTTSCVNASISDCADEYNKCMISWCVCINTCVLGSVVVSICTLAMPLLAMLSMQNK